MCWTKQIPFSNDDKETDNFDNDSDEERFIFLSLSFRFKDIRGICNIKGKRFMSTLYVIV